MLEVIEPLALVGTPISASEDAEAFCSLIDPLPLVDIARYVCQPALAIGLVIDENALEAASILASSVTRRPKKLTMHSSMPKPCFNAGFQRLTFRRALGSFLSGTRCQT